MLKGDIAVLERKRSIPIEGEIPLDDPLWSETDLPLKTPVSFNLTVSAVPSGEIVVRGTLSAGMERACRRCLKTLDVPFEEKLTLVFAPVDELAQEEEDGEVLPLKPGRELDLAEPLREEMILAVPAYVECRVDCRGLCPRCGADLNEDECDCTLQEQDPRWDALRTLKEK